MKVELAFLSQFLIRETYLRVRILLFSFGSHGALDGEMVSSRDGVSQGDVEMVRLKNIKNREDEKLGEEATDPVTQGSRQKSLHTYAATL